MERCPILLFADRLPPLIGGMEMHAHYFIQHFTEHPEYPLAGILTRDGEGRDCLLTRDGLVATAFPDLVDALGCRPEIVFFNSGRWVEDLGTIRRALPDALLAYRTGGNEILKAPLEKIDEPDHVARQRFWVEQLNTYLDILITNSAYTEERLGRLGVKPQLMARCIGGVNTAAIEDSLRALEWPDNCSLDSRRSVEWPGYCTLFSAARFVPYKNHQLLIDVAGRLRSRGLAFQLLLAGDGPLEPEIRTQVRALNLSDQVNFLGRLTNEDVCQHICRADIYIQFSVERGTEVPGGTYVHAEGMGRSILEAISAGTFVIAARSGALPEIVTGDRGVLFNLDSADAIADRLEPYINKPPSKRPSTDDYSWGSVFGRYVALWRRARCS